MTKRYHHIKTFKIAIVFIMILALRASDLQANEREILSKNDSFLFASSALTCSGAVELGPWYPVDGHGQDIFIDTGTGFVHADFWRPGGPQLKAGYDDVSVIILPGTKVTVLNVAGQAWKYGSDCTRAYVESQVSRYNTEKQQGGWTITNVSLSELPISNLQSSQLRLGVNMHPLQDVYAPNQSPQQIELARGIGASIVRIDIHWAWIEPTGPGPENWNRSQIDRLDIFLNELSGSNIKVLAVVTETPCWASTDPNRNCAAYSYDWRYPPTNPQDYANFLNELVKRYKDKIKYWEIWNEPNISAFWANPDPIVYTALLKAAYPVIKANDPTAVVVGGSLAPSNDALTYLEGMYSAGVKGYFDKLSYHPYTDGNTPTWYDSRWPMHGYSHSVPAIRQLMQSYGDSSPLWLTEMGWTTVPAASCSDCWTPTLPKTEAEQAAYMAEAINIARSWDYVETFFWYELIDMVQPPNPAVVSFEHYFGLFRKDYSAKPATIYYMEWTFPNKVFLPLISKQGR